MSLTQHFWKPSRRWATGAALVVVVGAIACDRKGSTDEARIAEQSAEPAQPSMEQVPTGDRNVRERQVQEAPSSGIAGNPPRGAAPGAGAQAPPANGPSDERLKKFAEAHRKVMAVNEKYTSRLSSAKDTDKAHAIQKEASEAINSAVADSGLTVSEYSRIAEMIQRDTALQQKFLSISSPSSPE